MSCCDRHNVKQLIGVFNTCFKASYNTGLVQGGFEPEYIPAGGERPHHQLVFRHDFFSSALHEIAHWCIAGSERRQQVDFGYWYQPDGRLAKQQKVFEQVEVRPQALEAVFSLAAGHDFQVSADNLEAGMEASDAFKQAVGEQVARYLEVGLPPRAKRFREALLTYYGVTSR